VAGEQFAGQRDCQKRLEPVLDKFKDKVVLDLGCNIGGMLHTLAPHIKYGVGFDNNAKYINVANMISRLNHTDHLDFFVFDLDKDLEYLKHFIYLPIDICLMLSIAKWVKRWKELITLLKPKTLLFETNGYTQGEQIKFLETLYNVEYITKRSTDDPLQHNRILLLCQMPQK